MAERWSLQSPFSPSECRDALEARRVQGLRLRESAERPLLGAVGANRFSLYRARRSRSPVLILADGRLIPGPDGTQVILSLRIDPVQLSLAIVLAASVALLLAFSQAWFGASATVAWPVGLFVLVALGLSVGLSARSASTDRVFLLACVRDALQATRVERIQGQ